MSSPTISGGTLRWNGTEWVTPNPNSIGQALQKTFSQRRPAWSPRDKDEWGGALGKVSPEAPSLAYPAAPVLWLEAQSTGASH